MKNKKEKQSIISLYRRYGIFLILLVLFIVSAIISPNFLKPQNLVNILKQISVVTIIACGETMLIVSGLIDLSAGMVCTLSMCFTAGILVKTGNVFLASSVGISLAMIAAWVSGFLVTHYHLPPFIATLAMTNIAKGTVQIYTNGQAISGVEKLRWIGQGYVLGLPIPVIIMFIVVAVIWVVMRYTPLGLSMYSIGGNEKATVASGINVNRSKRWIYLLSGLLVGIAGVVLTGRLMAGMPSVGAGYEFDAITASVVGGNSFLGGIGNVAGTLVGSIIVGLINNILNLLGVSTPYQLIVKGILIAGAVTIDLKTKDTSKGM